MITSTTLTITIDLNDGVEEAELTAVRRFLEIEQDRIAADFGFIFGLTPETSTPSAFTGSGGVGARWTQRLKRWWRHG